MLNKRQMLGYMLNGLLLIFMIFLGFFILNLTLNKWIHLAPISMMSHFHRSHHPLFQKFDETSPNWIMFAGDSHVAGVSDELLEDLEQGKDHFFPAENLGQMLKREVLGLATPGGGAAAALWYNPSTGLDFLKSNYMQSLPDPKLVILVYYGGNDLDDDLKQAIIPFFKTHRLEEFDNKAIWQRHLNVTLFDHAPHQWWNPRRLLVGDFMINKIKNLLTISSVRNRFTDVDSKTWTQEGIHKVKSGKFSLPANIQGPAPELVEVQVSHAMKSLEHVLALWRNDLPKSKLLLVYLPSTWNIYDLKTDNYNYIRSYHGINSEFSTSELELKHSKLVERLRTLSLRAGADFLDTTSDLKKYSGVEALHGPRDWNHLNKKGRLIFLESIAKHIEREKY